MEQKSQRLIVLFILCTAALLPIMLFRDPTISNELRYMSIVDEALSHGHFFAFYNHGIPYADKPPLFFWLMMLGKLIFGCHSMLYLSAISMVCAFVTVAVLDRWCAPSLPASLRTSAAVALVSTLYFTLSMNAVRMDMMMTMFITLALYTFYRIYEGDGRLRLRIAFPVYVFFAIFSKGAVGFLVPLLCVPAFLLVKKQLRSIGRYWGWMTWGILLLLCGTWFLMAYLEGGGEYLHNLLFHQTVDRAVNAFNHKAPFYFYIVHYWYIMFPWCLLAAGVMVLAFIQRQKMDDRALMLSCFTAVILVMLSLVSGKLDIYFLPAVGLAVYATFMLLPGFKARRFVKWALLIPFFLAVVALPAAFFIARGNGVSGAPLRSLSPWMLVPLEIGLVAAIVAAFRDNIKAATCCFAAGFYLALFVLGLEINQLDPFIGYRAVCEEAMAEADKRGIDRYVLAAKPDGTPQMKRGENADVYIGKPLELVPMSDIETSVESIVGDTNGIIVFTVKDKKPTFVVYEHD